MTRNWREWREEEPYGTAFHGGPSGPLDPYPQPGANNRELVITPDVQQTIRVRVNKSTHQIAYDAESEYQVVVAVKPKEQK